MGECQELICVKGIHADHQDTVSSLGGITLPRKFIKHFLTYCTSKISQKADDSGLPYAGNVKSVTFFRHALALDERRARFAPEYRHLDPNEERPNPDTCEAALTSAKTAHDTLHAPTASATDRVEARRTIQGLLDEKYPKLGGQGYGVMKEKWRLGF